MNFRTLGRTGLLVSEIGYGTWGIGNGVWVGAEHQLSLSALKTGKDAGINFFDTALAYGTGYSEQLLAEAFGNSPDVLVATKVPPKNRMWSPRRAPPLENVFPRQYVMNCLDKSLRNLKRDTIDVYQFHVWSDDWAHDPEWVATIEEIRRSGKARFIGISVNDHQPGSVVKTLATGLIDTVQVIYNIFEQSPEDQLFPLCQKYGIGVIARVPLDEGGLTGAVKPGVAFDRNDFRRHYFRRSRKRQVWERVKTIASETGTSLERMPELALRFCLSPPAVSSVIVGMRRPEHVRSNVSASAKGVLPEQLCAQLHQYRWLRNFYVSPLREKLSLFFPPHGAKPHWQWRASGLAMVVGVLLMFWNKVLVGFGKIASWVRPSKAAQESK